MNSIPDVSWGRISGFIRQHTHDLRNELNGLDLEAALLADIVDDPEARESVTRMRSEIRKLAANLRSLSGKFAEVRPSRLRIPAREIFLIWQDQLSGVSGLDVEWKDELDGEDVEVDPSGVAQVLRELLVNAHAFTQGGKVRAISRSREGVQFELREQKKEVVEPLRWGQAPFASTRRGAYGLGLCTALQTVEANGGTLRWSFDPQAGELVTTLTFPTASAAEPH